MVRLRSLLVPLVIQGLWLSAGTPELETLLQRNLAARGGASSIAALRSIRFTGEMSFRGGFKLAYMQLTARPGKVREEITLQGLTQVLAYDQGAAWQINPFEGRKDPERMSGDEAKFLGHDADLDGPLVGWREEGSRVEYQGTEDVDGTQAHKLKVSLKDGSTKYVYLDPEHFLEIRILTQVMIRGSLQESEVDLGEYAKVAGVWFPMSLESGRPGGPRGQFLKFSKAEANLAVGEAEFRFPGDGKK
jgi:hypothetical protein